MEGQWGTRSWGQGLGATTRVTVSNPCLKLAASGTGGLLDAVGLCDSARIAPAQMIVTSNLIDVFKNNLSRPHVGPFLTACL
jgi:hypothetical protein